jgi:hypothetical protein
MHLGSKAVNDQELIRGSLSPLGLKDVMELAFWRVQHQQELPAPDLYA